jgi:DMSO/TMAO reductase YedYZ molybdopterin-dependent catalytic subunit
MVRAFAAIAWMLAGILASGGSVAQEIKSLVSTRLEVSGLVSHSLSLSVEELRAVAKRRGLTEAGGYGAISSRE